MGKKGEVILLGKREERKEPSNKEKDAPLTSPRCKEKAGGRTATPWPKKSLSRRSSRVYNKQERPAAPGIEIGFGRKSLSSLTADSEKKGDPSLEKGSSLHPLPTWKEKNTIRG